MTKIYKNGFPDKTTALTIQLLNNIDDIDPLMFLRIKNQDCVDIDVDFLGFIEQYNCLAKIIPLNFHIYDIGCALAPQAYYFRKHISYLGIDPFKRERFSFENTKFYVGKIEDFIEEKIEIKKPNFAICNYVPNLNKELVSKHFDNMFIFYPSMEDNPFKIIGSMLNRLKQS